MQYDDAVLAFFPARPPGTEVPEAVRLAGPARRLRDAAEPIGLGPVEMNVLTEVWHGIEQGSHTATRGWRTEQVAAGAALVDALGDALDDVVAALETWGTCCVTAGVFPADVLKRACG